MEINGDGCNFTGRDGLLTDDSGAKHAISMYSITRLKAKARTVVSYASSTHRSMRVPQIGESSGNIEGFEAWAQDILDTVTAFWAAMSRGCQFGTI